jgi:PAS domain S-box-containing protein
MNRAGVDPSDGAGARVRSYKNLVAASVLVPMLLFAVVAWEGYKDAMREAEQEVGRVADVLQGHALNVFETHQLVAQRVSDRILGMSWPDIERSGDIRAYLGKIRDEYQQIKGIWLADASGVVRNASEVLPPSPLSVADRDYFQALQVADAGTMIGHIVPGRVLKALNFNVARRRETQAGTFDGVVIVTAFPGYFTDFWNRIGPTGDIAAALARKDGAILARAPEMDRNVLRLPTDSPLREAIRRAERGRYRAVSTLDNKERLYAYRRVGEYDAYVGYGITVHHALSPWRSHLVRSGSAFAIASAALLLLSLGAQERARQEQQAIRQWQETAGKLREEVARRADAEADLRRSEERFHATVESAPSAIVMMDAGGKIVVSNAATEKLFDYSHDELLGQQIEVLMPDRFREEHRRHRFAYVEAPSARTMGAGRALYGRRKDGSELRIEVNVSPVETREGLFVLAAIADVTERTRQTEALRKANDALERSNIELQRFAYLASHDLQTPMRTVASFVELLGSTYGDKLDAQARDWIQRTIRATHHLQAMVRDVLEYSRVDSQARPFEPVELRQVYDHALLLLEAAIREAAGEVSCGELPLVMGDRAQLVQLMVNLMGNALKYRSADPPRIRVSAERKDTEWQVAVSDNGIGIPLRYHERIFEIFERLHDERDRPGTGIGLAVCRRVVHRHGGRIWVESEPGKGSTFHFTIPEGTVNAS